MDRRIGLTLVFTLLSACTSEPSTTTSPTLVRVVTSPAHETLVTQWVEAFPISSAARIEIIVSPPQEIADAVRGREAELALTGKPPPNGWFASPLREEGIVVIVHPENPVRAFTLEDLAAVFSGQVMNWRELGGANQAIQPVIALPTDELRERFEDIVLGELKPAANALLAPSPYAMSGYVAEEPGAIGYLPMANLSAKIRAARVEGIEPSDITILDGRYPLTITVLAFARKEPDGILREWLAWIQSSYDSIADVRGGSPP